MDRQITNGTPIVFSQTRNVRSRRSTNFIASAPIMTGTANIADALLNKARPSTQPNIPFHPHQGRRARKRCKPRHKAPVTNIADSVSFVV